jgi:hypothetical protein
LPRIASEVLMRHSPPAARILLVFQGAAKRRGHQF